MYIYSKSMLSLYILLITLQDGIIQLSNRVHSRMEAFDDEYLFQAYRDMFWRDDPEDHTPTYIAPPRHMTSRSKLIHLSNVEDDDYDDLYNS